MKIKQPRIILVLVLLLMSAEQVNRRIASERAKMVKKQLVRRGITADKIIAEVYGVDRTAKESVKARRAETKKREAQ